MADLDTSHTERELEADSKHIITRIRSAAQLASDSTSIRKWLIIIECRNTCECVYDSNSYARPWAGKKETNFEAAEPERNGLTAVNRCGKKKQRGSDVDASPWCVGVGVCVRALTETLLFSLLCRCVGVSSTSRCDTLLNVESNDNECTVAQYDRNRHG